MVGDVNGACMNVSNGHNLQNERDLQRLRVYMRTDTLGRDIIKQFRHENDAVLPLIYASLLEAITVKYHFLFSLVVCQPEKITTPRIPIMYM